MEITRTKVLGYFEEFKSKKVLIIGDVMIDSYMWGKVNRISPEAPIPIVSITNREYRLGGAANVALNIKSMGAEPFLCSIIGDDIEAHTFTSLLTENSLSAEGVIKLSDRKTTIKTRIISGSQHLLRVDDEVDSLISKSASELLISKAKNIIQTHKIDIVIFEDYDKGVLSFDSISQIIEFAKQNSVLTAVDPKKRNFNLYAGVDLFKPNFKEFNEGRKLELEKSNLEGINAAAKHFLDEFSIGKLLLTLSDLGIFISDNKNQFHFPAELRNVADVSGAGDSVISIASLLLSVGASICEIAYISNIAGGLVCEKSGVVPIVYDELLAQF